VSHATTLAEALVSAHERGIVHRDLKSANVMVNRDGRLKVLDFGLARPTRYSEPSEGLTREGLIMGMVPYMSPEQLRGRSPDQRSDLFSFGIVLYEKATGRRPSTGTTAEVIPALLATSAARPSARSTLAFGGARRHRESMPGESPRSVTRAYASGVASWSRCGNKRCLTTRMAGPAVAAETDDSPSFAQEIRSCETKDGYTVAYATAGSGRPLVRVLGWFTHLEKE
jgi:serine/threonine protein kinase